MSVVALPLELFIDCDPAPKGSVQADPNRHIRHTKRSRTAERAIKDACVRHLAVAWPARTVASAFDVPAEMLGDLEPFAGPVVVTAEFVIRQPPDVYYPWPTTLRFGDLDKHARTLLDGITDSLIRDDSQVMRLDVTKRWAQPTERPGIRLWLRVPGPADDAGLAALRFRGEIGGLFDGAVAEAFDVSAEQFLRDIGIRLDSGVIENGQHQ